MDRNPFIIPLSMDQRPKTGNKKDGGALLTGHKSEEGANADPGFTSIGGMVRGGNVTHQTHQKQLTGKKKSQPSPFATPVINDPDLILEKKSPGRKKGGKTTHTAKQSQVAPSTVGDLDLLRIRNAEKVILAEEAIQGQYLRDAHGRLVPAWQAERERFSTDVATDDNRPLSQQARVPDGSMAPFADTSGFGINSMNAAEQREFLLSKDDTDVSGDGSGKRSKAKRAKKVSAGHSYGALRICLFASLRRTHCHFNTNSSLCSLTRFSLLEGSLLRSAAGPVEGEQDRRIAAHCHDCRYLREEEGAVPPQQGCYS